MDFIFEPTAFEKTKADPRWEAKKKREHLKTVKSRYEVLKTGNITTGNIISELQKIEVVYLEYNETPPLEIAINIAFYKLVLERSTPAEEIEYKPKPRKPKAGQISLF